MPAAWKTLPTWFDPLLELRSRRRAKTAASAARAALGETALQRAVEGEPINRKKMTAKSWRGNKDPACSVQ